MTKKTLASNNPTVDIPDNDQTDDDGRTPSTLGDRWIATITLALGVAMLVLALRFPEPGQPEDPGTAALPQIIGGGWNWLHLGAGPFRLRHRDTTVHGAWTTHHGCEKPTSADCRAYSRHAPHLLLVHGRSGRLPAFRLH